MRKFLLLVPLIILFVFLWQTKPKQQIIMVGGKAVRSEIARTEEEREKGLSDRRSLCQDCGLLFLFDRPNYYSFWMRRMYFDIDIIWIANDRVVEITDEAKAPASDAVAEFASPKQIYTSKVPADKVLEVNAGWAKKNGVKIGDEVNAD